MNLGSFLSIITVLSGAALEYYDYMLFTLMIPIISPIFNGGSSVQSSLTSGYLIVFLGALMRPLGGLVIGYIGDKKGREVALFLSMIIMAFSSVIIVFLPTYAQIGVWASVFLMLCRMLQTMSAASELNGAAIFLIEQLDTDPKHSRKGFSSGLAWSFTVLGMLGGSVASYYSNLSNWKVPFLLGGLIGVFAIILRLLPKVKANVKHQNQEKKTEFNFIRSVSSSILIACGISGMFYYNMIWMIGNLQCKLDPILVREYSIYYFAIYAFVLLISGILSDYLKKMYLVLLTVPVLLALLAIPSLIFESLFFNILNVILIGIYVGPSHAILFELFPKEYRFRGVSITYSIGTSIIGGSTPFMCNYFSHKYVYFPALWLTFVSILAFCGIFLSRKKLT